MRRRRQARLPLPLRAEARRCWMRTPRHQVSFPSGRVFVGAGGAWRGGRDGARPSRSDCGRDGTRSSNSLLPHDTRWRRSLVVCRSGRQALLSERHRHGEPRRASQRGAWLRSVREGGAEKVSDSGGLGNEHACAPQVVGLQHAFFVGQRTLEARYAPCGRAGDGAELQRMRRRVRHTAR